MVLKTFSNINSFKGVSDYYIPPRSLKDKDHDELVSNDLLTQSRIGYDKFSSALTTYTKKGFQGNKNCNFYEFLTLGTIPYLIGSLMLIGVFNFGTKHFKPADAVKARVFGNKMALGVILYGVLKSVSKKFIEAPVNLLTGINSNMRYKKVVSELPTKDNPSPKSIEYHKVFESTGFPRWDLLYDVDKEGIHSNKYYDKVAKKIGLGENLPDSDQVVKPAIREIITKTRAWSTISSYLWAASGVALAVQKPFDTYFAGVKNLPFKEKISKAIEYTGKSIKSLWQGGTDVKSAKAGLAGKILVSAAVLSSVLGTVLSSYNFGRNSAIPSTSLIDKDRKVIEC